MQDYIRKDEEISDITVRRGKDDDEKTCIELYELVQSIFAKEDEIVFKHEIYGFDSDMMIYYKNDIKIILRLDYCYLYVTVEVKDKKTLDELYDILGNAGFEQRELIHIQPKN